MRTPREHFAIREEALTLATTQIAIQLQLININFERIKETEWELVRHAWRRHPVRKGLKIEFNWLAHRNKRRDKLDVSIWSQGVLCGLFLAKLSRKSINVALRYLESNPYCHPLSGKVIPVGLIIAESFAVSYGAYQVMVCRPERHLIKYYRSFGYELNDADLQRERRNFKIRANSLVKKL